MKKTMTSLIITSILLLAASAHADSSKLGNCELQVTRKGAATLEPIPFMTAVSPMGATEVKATYDSVTFTLGEAGEQSYVNVQDNQRKIYFSAAFAGAALYAASGATLQVICK